MACKEKFLGVKATNGVSIILNISDEACLPFGFKHGDRIVNCDGKEFIFMGVARNPCQCPNCVLSGFWNAILPWVAKDDNNRNVVSGVSEKGNLRNIGTVLKSEVEESEKMPDPVEFVEITTADGRYTFKVDISDTACTQYGFKHKDRVLCPDGSKATVTGVASMNPGKKYGKKALWCIVDDGRIACVVDYKTDETNLVKLGFKLLEDEKK